MDIFMSKESPETICLKDYCPPEYLIVRADLRFELEELETRVYSVLTLRRNPKSKCKIIDLKLHGKELQLLSISLDGKALEPSSYRLDQEGLTVFNVPDSFSLETEVRIHPEENSSLEGLYKSNDIFCTQCEPEGFRHITWFVDRPDVMAKFTTTIIANKKR